VRAGISIVVLSIASALALEASAAYAADTTTTTRAASSASSTASPLLRKSDLPKKYTSVAEPASTTSQSPRYPTVDASCVVNPQVPFSGLVPKTSLLSWATGSTGVTGGAETTYVYDDVTTAKALYRNFADTYEALTRCPTAKQTIPASGSTPARTVDIGSWKALAIPAVGEEQIGIELTPTASTTNTSRIALWRDGGTVVVLNLRDKAQPKAVFNKLVTTAEQRVEQA